MLMIFRTIWCTGGQLVAPWGSGWSHRTWLGGGGCPWPECWARWLGRREWWAIPRSLFWRRWPKGRAKGGRGAWRVCPLWWTWCPFGRDCWGKWSGRRAQGLRTLPRTGWCRSTGLGWTSCTIWLNRRLQALRNIEAPWHTSPCTNHLPLSSLISS